ncbi:MAG TPA: secretin N-terminal domain-containing protein, partial [Allosphingosinicella sp.]|nr:secretin N-terminal domain-containing protein [Allosphingosinicella sp.]
MLAAPLTPAFAQHVVNFREADIRAFIEDAARVTGRTFIVDPAVSGKVSVVTQRPLSRSEYFELFLSTLRANGLMAVPLQGGAFRIQPIASGAAAGGRVASRGSANNFVTEIIRTRSIDAAQALEALKPLVSREGSITASRNSIVVADFADNVARIRAVLRSIDRDTSNSRIVALRNAGAREIATSLNALMEGSSPGGRSATIVPVDSSNSIAIRGDAASVARLAAMAEELDRRAATGTEIRVIFLQHADAAQLLPVLQQLLGQPVTQPPPSPGLSSSREEGATSTTTTRSGGARQPIRTTTTTEAPAPDSAAATGLSIFGPRGAVVTRFQGANALVIAASTDVQRQLGEVIRQLDTRREQVLVEAIIVEISDNAAKKLGVQLLLAGLGGSNIPFAVTNYSNASP